MSLVPPCFSCLVNLLYVYIPLFHFFLDTYCVPSQLVLRCILFCACYSLYPILSFSVFTDILHTSCSLCPNTHTSSSPFVHTSFLPILHSSLSSHFSSNFTPRISHPSSFIHFFPHPSIKYFPHSFIFRSPCIFHTSLYPYIIYSFFLFPFLPFPLPPFYCILIIFSNYLYLSSLQSS